jgi:molybdate transport system ATP-binding protein
MLSPDRPEPPGVRARLQIARGAFRLDLDLGLPADGVSAIFGPSGSGKTTCLRLIAGLDRGRGRLDVLGECWQDDSRGIFLPVHRRGVGCVFQDHTLFAHLSVAKNLAYGQRRSPREGGPNRDFVVDVLGIGQLLARTTEHLSGGERQRVAMAQAVLSRPRLLVMDEPLSALDTARKSEILPYIERLRGELAIPILYVSHSIDEVARLADHLVLIDAGRIIASGELRATLARLDLPTALAEDAGVVIDATVMAHDPPNHLTQLAFGGGSLWVAGVDHPIGARVRARALARDVSLALERPGPSSILNVLSGVVAEVCDSGPDRVNVRLAVGPGATPLLARITRRSRTALGIRPGLAVHAQVKGVALFA